MIEEFEAADTGLVVIEGKLIEKPALREMYRIVTLQIEWGYEMCYHNLIEEINSSVIC